jgi:hypothetical protein
MRSASSSIMVILSFVGCVGDSSSGTNDAGADAELTGTEGHACFPNDTCNAGLTCISKVCVNLDSGSSDAAQDSSGGDAPSTSIVVEKVTYGQAGSPSVTFPFDPGINANRLLVVGVSFAPNDVTTASVAFGGTTLQEVTTADGTVNGNGNPPGYSACRSRIFYMVNPAAPDNVVVTFAGNQPVYVAAGAIGFSGVDQSTPLQNGTHMTGSSASIALAVTTAPGHMTLANLCADSPTVTTTSGTQRWLLGNNLDGVGSTLVSNGTTSTHTWTQSDSDAWVVSGVDIVPAP